MSFIRNFDKANIDRMKGNLLSEAQSNFSFTSSGRYFRLDKSCNAALYEKLYADVLNGEVFPAVRINELHFYYKGGCLYKFAGGAFKRDKNYEKYGAGFGELPPYERAKRENEEKFKRCSGGDAERQLLDRLCCHTFNPDKKTNVVVLDIEVNLGGRAVQKCDLVLLNAQTQEIMFVEGKVFSDGRVNVAVSFTPEVISQVNTYSGAICNQCQNILEQYKRHIEILNGLFGSAYLPPEKLIMPAKLLVYGTPRNLNKNGEYTIAKINGELGAGNVLWVTDGEHPTPDEIWNLLAR